MQYTICNDWLENQHKIIKRFFCQGYQFALKRGSFAPKHSGTTIYI